jgi:hypothetical protein
LRGDNKPVSDYFNESVNKALAEGLKKLGRERLKTLFNKFKFKLY